MSGSVMRKCDDRGVGCMGGSVMKCGVGGSVMRCGVGGSVMRCGVGGSVMRWGSSCKSYHIQHCSTFIPSCSS